MTVAIDAFGTVRGMLAALDARRVSAVELLVGHLARIERYDKALNAIVVRDFERARADAAAADAARAGGARHPLLGLPMTLKESMNVSGLPTTVGVTAWAAFVSQHDAPVRERTKAAGAVLMGKTNVPPVLADWQATNPIYGRTVNPWDATRTPGGSSGGGAAAVAAGLTPLDYGSDIGGSIRVPAVFCGIYGHKPSETAVPRSGQMPVPPLPNPASVMAVQGPLARSAEDLELALDVVAGPEIGEDAAWRLTLPPARGARLADLRVALLPPIPWLPVDAEILAAQARVADALARAGARVETAQPEGFGDFRETFALYLSLLNAITSARVPLEERRRLVALQRAVDDPFAAAQVAGMEATAADYFAWLARRERQRAAYRAFFREWDVLLAPAFPTPAYPHVDMAYPRDAASLRHVLHVDGATIPYSYGLVHPAVATLAGQPATAFPAGRTRGGLPIGLQAIGPYLEDRTPIRFAALLADAIGGFERPPGFDAI